MHVQHGVALLLLIIDCPRRPGVTVVTTDCYQFDEVVNREFADDKGKILVLPTCLTDKTDDYTQFVHPQIRDRFTSYSEMLEEYVLIVVLLHCRRVSGSPIAL